MKINKTPKIPGIKILIGKSKKILSSNVGNRTVKNETEVAEEFNRFFISVGPNLASQILDPVFNCSHLEFMMT